MKFAIYRALDNSIVAAIDAPAAASSADLPALASGGYIEIDQATYDQLQGGMFEPFGLPLYQESGGSVVSRSPQEKWFAIIGPDNTVHGGGYSARGRPPKVPGTMRFIEIDQATFDQIDGEGQFLPDSTIARWSVDGSDNLIETADLRYKLDVAMSDTAIDVGSPVTITLTLRDAADQVVGFNGTRQLYVQHIAGGSAEIKVVRVSFSAGIASVPNKVLASGLWSIISHEPDQYRVIGDSVLRVAEIW
jgi:hypothetical protein